MNKEEHNGWTNYATWRVNLEMIDGRDWNEEGKNAFESVVMFAENIKDWCEDILEESVEQTINRDNKLVLSYALAFLYDVNWYEIAEHISEDYPKLVAKE